MNPIEMLLTAGGALLVLVSVLSQTELWQRKEYRWDRMRAHLRSQEWARQNGWLTLSSMLLLDAGWLMYLGGKIDVSEIFGWLAVALFAAYHGVRIVRRGLYRPVATVKSMLTLAVALILSGLYWYAFFYFNGMAALPLATLIFVVPLFTVLAVGGINILTYPRKQSIIELAHKRRVGLKNLQTLGITGSFGKTSTKIYLHHILESAGITHAISAAHRNSELAVAQDMLRKLRSELAIYVAEMGAYRAGDIKDLVDLVRPDIGVVTAIGTQHEALFGSKENIAKAKWELIEGLPRAGVAVLNADDSTIFERGQKETNRKIIWFSANKPADVFADHITAAAESVTAAIHIGQVARVVTIPLVGSFRLDGVLAAAAAAHVLHVPAAKILESLETLPAIPRTMELIAKPDYRIIDDSYSANEQGVLAAIRHLQLFPNNQVIIMTPVIELGERAAAAHFQIGQALADAQAAVLVFGEAHRRDIERGIADKKSPIDIRFFGDPKTMQAAARKMARDNAVILLEGRIPDVVRKGLL